MKPSFNPKMEVDILAKLADLRDADYQNTLVLHALIEILIQKGLFSREELVNRANQLDADLENQIHPVSPRQAGVQPSSPDINPAAIPAIPDHTAPSTPDSISASTTTPPAW